MPFCPKNAPAMFLSYIDDCLLPSIEEFAVCYLDDIHTNSTNEKEHEEHVRQALHRLREFGMYCKAEKYQFPVLEVGFLWFVIAPNGVGMESDQISTIEDWPTPKSVREVQVLLEFMNFYWRFIRKYVNVTLPLTEWLRKSESSCGKKLESSAKWDWTREAEWVFQKL